MYLTRHSEAGGPRWALDGRLLPAGLSLALLLELPPDGIERLLGSFAPGEPAAGPLLPPIEGPQEVWAAGVTYERSRQARKAESATGDVYDMVYDAVRPELFFKAAGWRVSGPGMPVRVRADSRWNVPEPELVLVINRNGEIVGYCAGNDVSSRDIEGANPLYLPQAKVYRGSCALGPGIFLTGPDGLRALPIQLTVTRDGSEVFSGEASTSQMHRRLEDLVSYLVSELDFPYGVFLMTGTCLVPPDSTTLLPGDIVRIGVGALRIENPVATG